MNMIGFSMKERLVICLLLNVVSVFCFAVQQKNGYENSLGNNHAGPCALALNGPGKSSFQDYSRSSFYGTQQSYNGPGTCITYASVNEALKQAKQYLKVRRPQKEWSPDELSTVGELFLEVSRILAKNYGLTAYQIVHKLPLLDTSHTNLIHYCPDYLSPIKCHPGRYRRHDGLCNNLEHPTWGARLTTFNRLISPVYTDGISSPRVGFGGYPLPSSRKISARVHQDEGYHDHAATVMVVAWGQFMDHDFTLQGTPVDPGTKNEFEDCCHKPSSSRSRYCMNIEIAPDDYFYAKYKVTCQDFVRAFPGVPHGCRLGARSQFNLLTATIDGNTVYGTSDTSSRELRAGYGGLLRMNKAFSQYGLKDLLPPRLKDADEGCQRPNKDTYCFLGGEIRVNEQLILTTIHTLMAREHNRVASQLSIVNPHWDDDQLYHETRHITIAMIQHITFNEFLPVLLGKEIMTKFDLLLKKEGYWNSYDPTVNPGVLASFSNAAFRFGHSLLPTDVERWSKSHKFVTSTKLSDLIRKPFQLYQPGVMDQYYIGLSNQVAQAMDDFVTGEVTNLLFKKPGSSFGVDLASFNLQRGREFGLPGYMAFRRYCGLPDAQGWEDLLGSMTNETVSRYMSAYQHHEDIDLWSGGVVERSLPGSLLGPTFACIIATQFSNARKGDRFWYEHGGQPSSFSYDQLAEIRKVRLARLICDNSDTIDTIQMYPMVLPDHEINPRVKCKSSILPYIDFTKWADYNYPSSFQKSITAVRPLAYPYPQGAPSTSSKNGKYIPEAAFALLREALANGRYSGYFVPPHRKAPPMVHPSGKRLLPTRRPVILSQEYVAGNDEKLSFSETSNTDNPPPISGYVHFPDDFLKRRISEVPELLNQYQPYNSDATSYRDLMTIIGILPFDSYNENGAGGFVPVHGPYGNMTMHELIEIADNLLYNNNFSPAQFSPNNYLSSYDLSLLASENHRQVRNNVNETKQSTEINSGVKISNKPMRKKNLKASDEVKRQGTQKVQKRSSEEEKLLPVDEELPSTTHKPLRLVRIAMVLEEKAKRRKREEDDNEALETQRLPQPLDASQKQQTPHASVPGSSEQSVRPSSSPSSSLTGQAPPIANKAHPISSSAAALGSSSSPAFSHQIPPPERVTPQIQISASSKTLAPPIGPPPVEFNLLEHAKAQELLNRSIESAAEAMKAFDQSYHDLQIALDEAKKFFSTDDPLLKNFKELLELTPTLNITVVRAHEIPVFGVESVVQPTLVRAPSEKEELKGKSKTVET